MRLTPFRESFRLHYSAEKICAGFRVSLIPFLEYSALRNTDIAVIERLAQFSARFSALQKKITKFTINATAIRARIEFDG